MNQTEAIALLTQHSLRHFVEHFWGLVRHEPFIAGYHIDAICEHLQAVKACQIRRLVINVGIRHGKSLLTGVFYPAWRWIHDPTNRIISATYSKDLTERDALRTKQLIQSNLYQACFGNLVQLNDKVNRQDAYENTARGSRLSASIGSRTAGYDADTVICDDLHDYKTRNSKAERTSAIDYFENSLTSRIVISEKDAVIVAGNRVHEDDVYAYIRNHYGNDGTWTYLVLPEEYTPTNYFNGIGWTDRRKEGELLWEEKYNADVVAAEKKRLRNDFYTIYQQNPTPAAGNLFKPEWIKYYNAGENRPGWRFGTVDLAIGTNSDNDYTVCQIWEAANGNLYLLHQWRGRVDGAKVIPTLKGLYDTWKPSFLVVEQFGYQKMVLDQLKANGVCVKAYKEQGNKEIKSITAQIKMEAGQVYFPAGAAYCADIEHELLTFPKASHDDIVDCVSMAAFISQRYDRRTEEEELPPEEKAKKDEEQRQKDFKRRLFAGL